MALSNAAVRVPWVRPCGKPRSVHGGRPCAQLAAHTSRPGGWMPEKRDARAHQTHTHSDAAALFVEAKVETNVNQHQTEKLSHVHMH